MVSSLPPIFNSSNPFNKHLGIVPNALITISITITNICHSFWHSLARCKYSSFFFLSCFRSSSLCGWPGYQNSLFSCYFFSLFLAFPAEIRWSVCFAKHQRIVYVLFSRPDPGLCIYHLAVWSNSNFLQYSQWIIFHAQSCLFSFFCCAVQCIYLLFDWLFRLYHNISYTCYPILFYLFSLLYIWSYSVVLRSQSK